jgi:hypothetical protein
LAERLGYRAGSPKSRVVAPLTGLCHLRRRSPPATPPSPMRSISDADPKAPECLRPPNLPPSGVQTGAPKISNIAGRRMLRYTGNTGRLQPCGQNALLGTIAGSRKRYLSSHIHCPTQGLPSRQPRSRRHVMMTLFGLDPATVAKSQQASRSSPFGLNAVMACIMARCPASGSAGTQRSPVKEIGKTLSSPGNIPIALACPVTGTVADAVMTTVMIVLSSQLMDVLQLWEGFTASVNHLARLLSAWGPSAACRRMFRSARPGFVSHAQSSQFALGAEARPREPGGIIDARVTGRGRW